MINHYERYAKLKKGWKISILLILIHIPNNTRQTFADRYSYLHWWLGAKDWII